MDEVRDVPEIAPLINSHGDTGSNAEMSVNSLGSMGWNSTGKGAARWGLRDKLKHYQGINSDNPWNTAAAYFSSVHEAGHLVERALTQRDYRAVDPSRLETIYGRGNVSDVLIRHVLTEMLGEGNEDVADLLEDLGAHAPNGFGGMDLRPTGYNGQKIFSGETTALMEGLRERGFTSGYGSTDPMEAFAESYARVYEQGEDADEFTKRLVRTSQELLHDPEELDRVFRQYSHQDTNLDLQAMPL